MICSYYSIFKYCNTFLSSFIDFISPWNKQLAGILGNSLSLLLIITTSFVTIILRTLPLFIKIPEKNYFINKFFEALPYSVLTLLIFPGILTSGGTTSYDLLKILFGIGVITYLSFKKYGLGIIILISLIVIFIFDSIKILLYK